MKYLIARCVYDRGNSYYKTSYFDASCDKEALVKVIDCCMYGGVFFNNGKAFEGEEGEVGGRELSEADLIRAIYEQNGDGCDCIFLLQNVNTLKILIQQKDLFVEEESW